MKLTIDFSSCTEYYRIIGLNYCPMTNQEVPPNFVVIPTDGSPIILNDDDVQTVQTVGGRYQASLIDGTLFSVEGCPAADGKTPCPHCGGGWAGKGATTEALTQLVLQDKCVPTRLRCQTIEDSASEGILFLYEHPVKA